MRCLYDGVHPCGRCPACLANRQRAFCFRLDQERESCSWYYWLTLQYDEDHVPHIENSSEYCFSKQHCREFFEKLRKRYNSVKFKHFLVSEYGPNGTHRPHYHCLLLVYSKDPIKLQIEMREEMKDFILNVAWPNGHVTEKSFHGRVLRYLTKYCTKPELIGEKHTMKPFTLISKGIGISYLDKLPAKQLDQMKQSLDFTVRYGSGFIQLPRYYVDKILPHSMEDLRKVTPTKNLDRLSSWTEYNKLVEVRTSLANRQNLLVSQRVNKLLQQNLDPIEEIRFREISRNAVYDNFRSKLKSRKDL